MFILPLHYMSKRKNLEPISFDFQVSKRIKKPQIIPKMNFLFVIKHEHTKWISEGPYSAFDAQNLLSSEPITVKVARKVPLTIYSCGEDRLRKFLEDFFKTVPDDRIERIFRKKRKKQKLRSN